MGEHVCKCRSCQPDAFPSGGRQNEGHVAIRLGDDGRDPRIRVLLDGVDVTDRCDEAIPGADGLAVLYIGPCRAYGDPDPDMTEDHPCRYCYRHGCTDVRRGRVEVRISGVPKEASE